MRDDVAGALRKIKADPEAGGFTAEFYFDHSLPVFQGHFPQRPLLPGVLQIEMVRYAAEQFLGLSYNIAEVGKAKFSGEIKPGSTIILNGYISGEPNAIEIKGRMLVEEALAATLTLKLIPRK